MIIKTFQKMKESSICVKLDLIPEKRSYSDCVFMKKKTLAEASEIMGYSTRTVDRINRKLKKKIMKVAPMYCRGFSLYS